MPTKNSMLEYYNRSGHRQERHAYQAGMLGQVKSAEEDGEKLPILGCHHDGVITEDEYVQQGKKIERK